MLYNEKEVVEICKKYGIETEVTDGYPTYMGKEMDENFSISEIMHMSKVNVHDFLMNNAESMRYALVEYDGHIEAVYFVQHSHNGKPWFLESPCNPCKEHEFVDNENIEEWCLSMAEELLEPDVDRKEYYEQYMKPLIVGNVLYDIYCPQVAPYLPKEVDDIIPVTKRECLLYMLDIESFEALRSKRDAMKNLRKRLASSDKPFTNVGIPS